MQTKMKKIINNDKIDESNEYDFHKNQYKQDRTLHKMSLLNRKNTVIQNEMQIMKKHEDNKQK